jgi:multidrug efflux pump subunit AcrB
MGKYLFTPLALSVTFAMFASYLLSRTLSPAYCAYFLKAHQPGTKRFMLFRASDAASDLLRRGYTAVLRRTIAWRWAAIGGALVLLLGSLMLYPLVGQELFPGTDAGQIIINVRVPAGTRLEKIEKPPAAVAQAAGLVQVGLQLGGSVAEPRKPSSTKEWLSGEIEVEEQGVKKKIKVAKGIEDVIMDVIPAAHRQLLLADMGVLYDWPAGYTANAGPMDATIVVQLSDLHERGITSQEYAERLRQAFAADPHFAPVQFAFSTGGMVSAALNFGLPSPINVQVRGRNMQTQYEIAKELRELIKQVPNAVDVRIQQAIDYPTVRLELDRKKMADLGITMEDAAKNLLSVLNSSTVFDAAFWLDHVSGNHIFMGVTFKEEDITWDNLMLTPIKGKNANGPAQQVQNLVTKVDWEKKTAVEINHNDLARVIDIFVNVQGRDVGSIARDIEAVLSKWGKRNPTTEANVTSWAVPDAKNPGQSLAGYAVLMRGEVASMKESFRSLGFGFLLASVLIYLIMVAQFRSFLDPFIIMFAVPLGLIGVLLILLLTGTTLNVQSALGVIFMVGIAVSNSILLVEFANRLRAEQGLSAWEAAIQSGSVRLRPILMTSLAAVAGLLPLAFATGEASAPLARTVIGGLSVSTALTIFVVPCLYVVFKGGRRTT